MHGWCWSVIFEIIILVCELVAVSKMSKPNKSFTTALVRRHLEVTLPVELDLRFGMRRYLLLITDDKG